MYRWAFGQDKHIYNIINSLWTYLKEMGTTNLK
jgi:hypothetical protein